MPNASFPRPRLINIFMLRACSSTYIYKQTGISSLKVSAIITTIVDIHYYIRHSPCAPTSLPLTSGLPSLAHSFQVARLNRHRRSGTILLLCVISPIVSWRCPAGDHRTTLLPTFFSRTRCISYTVYRSTVHKAHSVSNTNSAF